MKLSDAMTDLSPWSFLFLHGERWLLAGESAIGLAIARQNFEFQTERNSCAARRALLSLEVLGGKLSLVNKFFRKNNCLKN